MPRTPRYLTILAALALAACQAAPAPQAVMSFPGMIPGRGAIALAPTVVRGGARQLLTVVAPWTEASIDHLVVKLYHPDAPTVPRQTLTVGNAQLYNAIVFSNLAPNTTYRVTADAYRAPGEAPADRISNPATSYVDVVVADDDRPAMGNLVVDLEDVTFAGEARTSGLVVEPGGFSVPSSGTINKTTPLTFDRATVVVKDAALDYRAGIAIAADGTIYLASRDSGRIFVQRPSEMLAVFSGRELTFEEPRASRDGDAATATFNEPQALALGSDGTLYVADLSAIRKVDANGAVTTLAGHPTDTGYYDAQARFNNTGADARFDRPMGLAVTSAGDVIVADTGNGCLRRVEANGLGNTIATIPAFGVTLDRKGDYVVTGNSALSRSTPAGAVTTIATGFTDAHGVVMDHAGHFYVADVWTVVRVAPGGARQTVAGVQGNGIESADDVPIGDVRFSDARGLARNASGEVFVTEASRSKLWRLHQLGVP
jgi:hypothetical protein